MTPTRRSQWVRQALQVTLEGDRNLHDCVETLAAAVEAIPSREDRKAIVSALKRGLRSRLRGKAATIKSGSPLPTEIAERLDRLARDKGARIVEHEVRPTLLAGFQFQLGDDRTDLTLLKNINNF